MKKLLALITITMLLGATANAQVGPHLIVYKTKANYNNKVPVTLAADKQSIVSYPAPTDVKGAKQQPDKLHKGYLMDNRGVSENTAFLSITYDKYAALTGAPSMAELMKLVVAKDPMITICDCGLRKNYKNPKTQVNKMIDNGTLLKKCKSMK